MRPLRAELLGYSRVEKDRKPESLPEPPRLPQRAAIYIAKDGTVHFGALFEGLVPVARSLNPVRVFNGNPNSSRVHDTE